MPELKAIFFDIDGTIIHTEKDGHRVAFNQTFAELGYDFSWGVDEYGDMLKISGGKERMRSYFSQHGLFRELDEEGLAEHIKKLHRRKTEIFVSLIEEGKLRLRPGIRRLMEEAVGDGLILGICTTANEKSAQAVVNSALQGIPFEFVLAGDIVRHKKPDPEIYNLALSRSGIPPENCLVVEDSHNGMKASVDAGIPVIVTSNDYTGHEDFRDAEIVLTTLGDPDGEQGTLNSSKTPFDFNGYITLEQLKAYYLGM